MDRAAEVIISPKTQRSRFKERVLKHMANATPLDNKSTEAQARDKVAEELRNMRKKVSNSLFIEQRKKLIQTEQKSLTDALTGLYNRRYFFGDENNPGSTGELHRLFLEANRAGDPLTILILDGDHFKNVNDTFGHQEGDRVLQQLADKIKTICRESDSVGRYGGEEFIIVSQDTNLSQALEFGERIRKGIEGYNFNPDNQMNKRKSMTASVGVATYFPEESSTIESEKQLLQLADKALYLAKQSGRNNVKTMLDLKKSMP